VRKQRILFAAIVFVLTAGAVWAGPYRGAFGGVRYDDPRFTGWATGITLNLPDGFDPTGGFDDPAKALGPAPAAPNDVVSFGNGGSAVLTFGVPVRDNPGPDLAVFENGYNDPIFAELAFVEVSTDNVHYARFPSVSLTPSWPGEYATIDATDVYNLAGKHVNNYDQAWLGTSFDLAELAGHPLVTAGLVDLGNIDYVRIIDVYGHSDGTTTDDARSLIDPATGVNYTTDHVIYDGGNYGGLLTGFDLDAVGVLHPLAGDADGDGKVDGGDLALWQQHYDPLGVNGTANTWAWGNWDDDNRIDGADLALWQQHYNPLGLGGAGTTGAAGSLAIAPEPASLALVVLGAVASAATRTARRRRRT